MNTDQPKPTTGEWTVETVESLVAASLNPGWTVIADAHNAALAAERELRKELEDQNKTFRAAQKACEDCDGPTMAEVQQMREELAAERERADKLADTLEATALELHDARQQLEAEAARCYNDGWVAGREPLQKQLAAETERADKAAARAELAQIALAAEKLRHIQ